MPDNKLSHSNKNHFLLSLLTVIILSATFVVSFYGKIIQDPNGHFFIGNGDGIKNYYTYAYFIKNNTSNSNLEGMNYPYGENFLYTDGHPVIASSLKWLSNIIPGIEDNSIGILNTLLLLSLVITSIFLFLIFYELKVNYVLAILGAVGIMVLSPQLPRLTGHYALSYSCAIPINLYLLLRFEKGNSNLLYTILLTINNLFWLFIHAYLGMIVISTTLAYLLIKIIIEFKEKRINSRTYIDLFASVIVPIAFFLIILKFTDIHVGRTTNAGNLLKSSVNLSTIFLPNNLSPYYSFFKSLFPKAKITWENLAYIGLITDLILITFIVGFIRRSVKAKKLFLKPVWLDNKFLKIALGASILILLFAMDYPFILGMENLLENKPFEIIKNFKANGRFAWVFYFVITIVSVYLINHFSNYLTNRNNKWLAFFLILFYPSSLFFEGYFYHVKISKKITNTPNLFNYDLLDSKLKEAINHIDATKYQAILPLPFYHVGSGNFRHNVKTRKKVEVLTLATSFHTSLPTFASRLTRVSIPESKNIIQLLTYPFYKKRIEKDLKDNRPILIIKGNEPISEYESYYLEKSILIYDGGDFQFLSIKKDVFFRSTADEEFEKYNSIKTNLYPKNGFLMSDTNSYFSYFDFEEFPDSIAYRGSGIYKNNKKIPRKIVKLDPNDFELNKKYIASIWVYNDGPNYGQSQLEGLFVLKETIRGKGKWKSKFNPRDCQTIDGSWSLVELEFTITDPKAEYRLLLIGNKRLDRTIIADDLLIYEEGNLIYRLEKEGGKRFLFKNNHKIPLDR